MFLIARLKNGMIPPMVAHATKLENKFPDTSQIIPPIHHQNTALRAVSQSNEGDAVVVFMDENINNKLALFSL